MQNQQNDYRHHAPSNNGQYYQQQPQPVQGTNALAISSLVCGIIGWIIPILFALLAIIFGHVARSQIKRNGQGGAGLALAGLILGYIQFVIMSLGLLAAIVLPAYLVQARDKLAKRIAADKDNAIIINIPAEEMNIPGMEKHWNEFTVENGVLHAQLNPKSQLYPLIKSTNLSVTPQVMKDSIVWECQFEQRMRQSQMPKSCTTDGNITSL